MAHPDEMIQLVKQRSYAACIKEGFRLVADNPWKLFRSTWPYLLFVAVCLWIYYIIMVSIQMVHGATLNIIGIGLLVGSYVLLIVGMLFYSGRIMLLFRKVKEKGRVERIGAFRQFGDTSRCAIRLLPLALIEFLLTLLFVTLSPLAFVWALKQQTTTMLVCVSIGIIAVGLLLIIFFMPFIQAFYHALISDGKYVELLKTGYRHGFRFKGRILVANILAILLFSVASIVIALPLMLIMSANFFSNVGVLMGDPSGLPSYYPWLTAATYIISFFMLFFAGIFLYASNLFVYGSIEAQIEQREMMNMQISE